MKSMTIKLKTKVWELPNKMHFEVQKTSRAHVFKAKRGKGSYSRKNMTLDY